MLDLPPIPEPGDALAQPTRARLFRLLSELGRSSGTSELAERLDLHPNGIRVHLERLEQAGLIERSRIRQVRGRPTDAWSIAPDAEPAGRPPRAYRDVGRWLARALAAGTGLQGIEGIEGTGREIGRELAPRGAGSPAAAFRTSLASMGFQPAITEDVDQFRVCLRNCPYCDVVRENQAAVCTLHRGITRGLLDVLEPDAALTAFVPHDPDQAGCLIEVSGLSSDTPGSTATA